MTLANLILLKAQLFLSIKFCVPKTKFCVENLRSFSEKKLIRTYFTSNGNIQYGIRENRDVHTVTDIMDFKKIFPDIGINDL